MSDPQASIEGLFPPASEANTEDKQEGKEAVKETTKEDTKEDTKDEHHEEWLRLVGEMNKIAAGRSEADIPLSDGYWEARNEVQKHQAKK